VIRFERDDRDELWAVAEVAVGVERIPFRVPLGSPNGDDPDPGGLLQLPVVALPGRDLVDLVRAAAFGRPRDGDRRVAGGPRPPRRRGGRRRDPDRGQPATEGR